jgi:hypothetical protein
MTSKVFYMSCALAALSAGSCGVGPGATALSPVAPPSQWNHVSEFLSVDRIAAGDGLIWAVTEDGLMRNRIEGGEWVSIKGLAEEGKPHPFEAMIVDSEGTLWVGGEGLFARVGSGAAERYTTVEQSLGTVVSVAETEHGVHVSSGSKLVTHNAGEWTLQTLPFSSGPSASTREALWLGAGKQGLARVQGDEVEEFPDPLGDGDDSRRVRSLVAAGDRIWVLWAGDEDAYVGMLEDDLWHPWAVPDQVGKIVRLMGDGNNVFLQTTLGLLSIEQRAGEGVYPLEPLGNAEQAVAYSYLAEPIDLADDGDPAPEIETSSTKPLASATVAAGHKYVLEPMALVLVQTQLWSPVTALGGDGSHTVIGTSTTGTYVLEGTDVKTLLAPYEVKPRTPMTSFSAHSKFYYVLDGNKGAGVVEKGRFSTERLTTDEHENLLALHGDGGNGWAISLVPEFETLQFFEYGDGGFVKVLDRTVDIASGIGDIGGFVGRTDGSFWFTIISATEDLAMGVGAVHPSLDYIVYHGSVPMPSDQAAKIPNGVRHIALDDGGNIWLGGMEGAVMLDSNLEATVYREPQGLVGDMVIDMEVDSHGTLWVLTVDGLGWFADGGFKFPSEPPYRGTIISCLGLDSDGELLLADQEAVRRHKGLEFEVVVGINSLPGVNVLDVGAGADEKLWVVTDRAISISPDP